MNGRSRGPSYLLPAAVSVEKNGVTLSKMEEVASAEATWRFENWIKCHRLLAASSECIVKIGDVVLRFFLLPLEKTWKVNNERTLINEWYSLNVELVSSDEKLEQVFLTVDAGDYTELYETGIPVVLKKSAQNPLGTTLVTEEFLMFGKWMVHTSSGRKYFNDEMDDDYTLDIVDETLEVDLKVTQFQFSQESPNEEFSSSQSRGSTRGEGDPLKSVIRTVFEETDGKLFSDVKLVMADDVVLHSHQLILSGASPVFQAMFTTEMKESFTGEVKIVDIASPEMKLVLEFIYTGKVNSSSCADNISEVIHAASKYQLDGLLDYCDKLVITICNTKNAMALLKLAKTYNLPIASARVAGYIKIHAAEILMSQVQDN